MIFDVQIADYFAKIQGINIWLDRAMIFLAEFLPWLMGAIALWSIYNKYRRQLSDFIFVGLAPIIARFGINEFIYLFIKNPRPMDLGYPALIGAQPNPAFPSGHASFLFAMSFAVFLCGSKNNGLILLFLSVLCLVARMYCGAHFLSDVLAGVAIGIITAFILWFGYFKKRSAVV